MAELRGELEQTRKALEAAAAKHAEEMAAQSEGEEMAYLQQQLRRSYQQVLSLQQQVGARAHGHAADACCHLPICQWCALLCLPACLPYPVP